MTAEHFAREQGKLVEVVSYVAAALVITVAAAFSYAWLPAQVMSEGFGGLVVDEQFNWEIFLPCAASAVAMVLVGFATRAICQALARFAEVERARHSH